MKRFLFLLGLTVLSVSLCVSESNAADLGGFNNLQNMQVQQFEPLQNPFYDMQQLQNQYLEKKHSVNEFKDFEEQKAENEERIQKDLDRQKYLEERAVNTKSSKKFVNDNGLIKIESIY